MCARQAGFDGSLGPSGTVPSVEARIQQAVAHRVRTMGSRRREAWRILNGPGDGAPAGMTVDRYLDWLVMTAREQIDVDVVGRWIDGLAVVLAPRGIVLKTAARPVSRSGSRVVQGDVPAEGLWVREEDARFHVDLNDGLGTGLFLDQVDLRLAARVHAIDVEVLNLFAYTCSFSVHAALAGARRVTSVDVSKRSLARGRENMRASGLEPSRHRWFADDVREHLERHVRQSRPGYGLVILDPPVFGRSARGVFSLADELDGLLRDAISVVAADGVLVFSTHAEDLDREAVVAAIHRAARARDRCVSVLAEHGLPEWDHPIFDAAGEDGDRGNYLKGLVLRVG